MPAPVATVTPGQVSPRREVPGRIAHPEYVGKEAPTPFAGSEVKDAETIEAMRHACRIAARALAAAGSAVAPGVTTDEIDRIGHEYLLDHGAYPSTLVNIDITAYVGGVHGDTNATFFAGEPDEESRLLAERTHEAMLRGIKAALPGRRINIIGRVIEKYAARFGYGVVRDFTGHGIGTSFHSGLVVPHYDAAPQYDTVIEPGMTFTIEPMLNLGTPQWDLWDDGWTAVTRDRRRSAQFEHTILITDEGNEILTLP